MWYVVGYANVDEEKDVYLAIISREMKTSHGHAGRQPAYFM
jgi:hypothetical protein